MPVRLVRRMTSATRTWAAAHADGRRHVLARPHPDPVGQPAADPGADGEMTAARYAPIGCWPLGLEPRSSSRCPVRGSVIARLAATGPAAIRSCCSPPRCRARAARALDARPVRRRHRRWLRLRSRRRRHEEHGRARGRGHRAARRRGGGGRPRPGPRPDPGPAPRRPVRLHRRRGGRRQRWALARPHAARGRCAPRARSTSAAAYR